MKLKMKKLMVVLGCAAMVALSGCSAAKKSAESYGIIGSEDGPTAIWMTTRLPWSKDCPQSIRGVLVDSVRKHLTFVERYTLRLILSAFLAVLFTMLIFVATGQYRIAFSGGKITVEQKQLTDNSTTERRNP